MSFICDNCGKGMVYGASQSHKRGVAGKRWNKRAPVTARTFRPNIQKASFLIAEKKVSFTLCAKCLKKFKQDFKSADYSSKIALG